MSKEEFRERVLADQKIRKKEKLELYILEQRKKEYDYNGYRHDLYTRDLRKRVNSHIK